MTAGDDARPPTKCQVDRNSQFTLRVILMFQILNVIQDFRQCSRRASVLFLPRPVLRERVGMRVFLRRDEKKALSLTLSRSTGRGDRNRAVRRTSTRRFGRSPRIHVIADGEVISIGWKTSEIQNSI